MATDPVCKMEVPEKEMDSIRTKYGTKILFFCSDSCKKNFEKDPSKYT
ncbi:TPA: YHS domain-containing protein [archaeon]|uniref:YHS domain-containing protein n=1 Tax=Candidatus Naiadarchaeum limnaeum TaxID=2756139 RepID=A0A832URD8_9ARCH|nr:YHS domain-containing protein [Candidatus Naiadarchaeum limnaeum]